MIVLSMLSRFYRLNLMGILIKVTNQLCSDEELDIRLDIRLKNIRLDD